jgi:hypothetical protein
MRPRDLQHSRSKPCTCQHWSVWGVNQTYMSGSTIAKGSRPRPPCPAPFSPTYTWCAYYIVCET